MVKDLVFILRLLGSHRKGLNKRVAGLDSTSGFQRLWEQTGVREAGVEGGRPVPR